MTATSTMTPATADAVWEVLHEECGAVRDHGFVHHQTREHVSEWRFMGVLGFGGKFWRSVSHRPDGLFGELWFVNCYPEDSTSPRRDVIKRANARLWEIQQQYEAEALA